jgi:hypothetical protein
MKIIVFQNVMLCSMAGCYQYIGALRPGSQSLLPMSIPSYVCLPCTSALKMEEIDSLETLVMMYQTTSQHTSEDSNICTCVLCFVGTRRCFSDMYSLIKNRAKSCMLHLLASYRIWAIWCELNRKVCLCDYEYCFLGSYC